MTQKKKGSRFYDCSPQSLCPLRVKQSVETEQTILGHLETKPFLGRFCFDLFCLLERPSLEKTGPCDSCHSRNGRGGARVVLTLLPVVEQGVDVHAADDGRAGCPVLQRLVVDDVDDGHGADAVVLRDGLYQRLVPT